MKKTLLLLVAVPLLAGLAFAGNGEKVPVSLNTGSPVAKLLPPPPPILPPVISAGWYYSKCNGRIWVSVAPQPGGTGPLWFQFCIYTSPWTVTPAIYPPSSYNFPPNTTVTIPISPNQSTSYYLWVTDMTAGRSIYPASTSLNVNPPCRIRKIDFNEWWPPQGVARTAYPVDPNEAAEVPDLLVRWKLEELNVETGEPVFTIDNPPCWADCNHAGASNPFNGFHAGDPASIDNLIAGNCSGTTDPGIFDETKTYRVTRSYQMPGESDWTDDAILMGPTDGGGDGTAKMLSAEQLETADLFVVSVDREQNAAVFNTLVDEGKMRIYDLSGREKGMFDLQKEAFEYGLFIDSYAPGTYIATLESGTRVITKKFVIE